jgi:hypothetical protein
MNAVIIFDVNNSHDKVVQHMMRMGYHRTWMSAEKLFNLPHNMLWKPNTEIQTAKQDLQNVIAFLNNPSQLPLNQPPLFNNMAGLYGMGRQRITLLRCIVLSSTPWAGEVGSAVPPAAFGHVA